MVLVRRSSEWSARRGGIACRPCRVLAPVGVAVRLVQHRQGRQGQQVAPVSPFGPCGSNRIAHNALQDPAGQQCSDVRPSPPAGPVSPFGTLWPLDALHCLRPGRARVALRPLRSDRPRRRLPVHLGRRRSGTRRSLLERLDDVGFVIERDDDRRRVLLLDKPEDVGILRDRDFRHRVAPALFVSVPDQMRTL